MAVLKKVRPGDRLRIPAETFNAFIDTTRTVRSRPWDGLLAEPAFHQAGIVPVKNTTDKDLGRFEVLGIDGPIYEPVRSEEGFRDRVAFVGAKPDEETHRGKFVVLLEPLSIGAIGRACVSGVCQARINVVDEEHLFADVEDCCTEHLKTGDCGSAFILWKERPEYGEYGDCYDDDYGDYQYDYGYEYEYGYGNLRWAVVRLSNLSDGCCCAEQDQWGSV